MEVLLELLIFLGLARLLGEGAEKVGLQSSVGEILAGVLFAAAASMMPEKFSMIDQIAQGEHLAAAASVAMFALILHAAVEMKPRNMARRAAGSLFIALGGMAVPLAAGLLVGMLVLPEGPLKSSQTLLIGIALSISAIAAAIKVLSELNLEHTRVGETIIFSAVIDDVLGLFLLAILMSVIQTGHIPAVTSLLILFFKILIFFTVTILLGVHVYPKISRKLNVLEATSLEFSVLVAIALAYGVLAEALGMHWIMGAFMAGLFFEPGRVGHKAFTETRIIFSAVTRGVLGPLFFAYIGLRVDLSAFGAVPGFMLLLFLVAIVGKLVGAGVPALLNGLSPRDAAAVGAGLSSRGGVEMVVLSIAYEAGVFVTESGAAPVVTHLFSTLIIVAVATTMLSPVMLRRLLGNK